MEKSEPITTEPISPPPYDAIEDKAEQILNTQSGQVFQEAKTIQQPPPGQAAVITIVQQTTNQTSLFECDCPWWGFCCLSGWFLGIGSLVTDIKIHGSATWIGWLLAIMGASRWVGTFLLVFGFFISGSLGIWPNNLSILNNKFVVIKTELFF